jgi:hypothetical protein
MKAKSGGGINSVVNRKVGVKGGSRAADKGSPAGVAQLGIAQGSRMKREGSYTTQSSATPLFSGTKANPVAFGNAKALDVGKGGVGTGRTIYPSGYQTRHGAPVQGSSPQPVDILSGFGSEVTDGSALRRR